LFQIGPANQRSLRSIAVHIPWLGRSDDAHLDLGSNYNSNDIPKWMKQRLTQLWLRSTKRKDPQTLEDCVNYCLRTLEHAGGLTSVKLVIPDTYELCTDIVKANPWRFASFAMERYKLSTIFDRGKFGEEFTVSLVHLQGGFADAGNQSRVRRERVRCFTSQRPVTDFARAQGWSIETMVYDELGEYPAQLRCCDRIMDVTDENEA
jgi:hypothetical protein